MLGLPFGPNRQRKGEPSGRVSVRLGTVDCDPAEPSTLECAVPNWRACDTIPTGRNTLRVVAVRDDDADAPPVLIVEELP